VLWLPLMLLKWGIRLVLALLLLPLVVIAGVVAVALAGVTAAVVLVPLLPIALLLFLGWLMFGRSVVVSPNGA
jgi:hypothetical protein